MPYRLRVRAGPSVPELRLIPINTDDHPILITSQHFTGRLVIRVRNFTGLTPVNAPPSQRTSPYFDSSRDLYSIQAQGRFKGKWNSDDLVFGNQFDKPMKLPLGTGIAVQFVKWFDPGLECDLNTQQPWAFSPLVVTMNAMRLTKVGGEKVFNKPHEDLIIGNEDPMDLSQWPSYGGKRIEEKFEIPNSNDSRRRYFAQPAKRKEFEITQDQEWEMDFHNQYVDFDKFRLRLPVFDINVLKYWNGEQPLRYIAKSRDSKAIFFVVEFMLINVDEEGDECVVVEETEDGKEGAIVGRGPDAVRWKSGKNEK